MWSCPVGRRMAGMKVGMKEGEYGYFMKVRIRCERNEELLGKRRCTVCAFEEYPEMCGSLRCWPTKKTQLYYRICDKRPGRNKTKNHNNEKAKTQENDAADRQEKVCKGLSERPGD